MTDQVKQDAETKEVIAEAVQAVVEDKTDETSEAPAPEKRAGKHWAAEAAQATHNPLTIPWPADPQGALMGLKRGGVEAAKRINGNPDRLKAFERSVRLLVQHARARFEQDTAARNTARENAVAAERRVLDKTKRQLEARAQELRDAAERAQKQAAQYGE